MYRKAFTLVELLVVMGIMAVLTSLVVPVVARAQRMANQTDSISNLRQCAVAMALYMEGEDIRNLPSFETTKKILASAPTCDRSDYLRRDCSEASALPLIGSYAYIRGVDEVGTHWTQEDEWSAFVGKVPDPYLFASVYYGDRQVVPYDWNDRNPCVMDLSCAFPSRLLRVKLDTSVNVTNYHSAPKQGGQGTYLLFGWAAVFTVL